MNETLRTIAERYSCRAYTSRVPDRETLLSVARAAVEAPSAMNRQNWRVVVVTDTALIAELEAEGMSRIAAMEDKSLHERIMSRGGKLFYNAPCVFYVAIPGAGDVLDCGIAVENIALAASSLGLGNVICGLAGLSFAGEKSEYFKSKLGFPDGWEFGMAVLMGYAEGEGKPHEPDMSKISFVG